MTKTVFILGNSGDEHARLVHDLLGERGASAFYVDGKRFPKDLKISIEAHTGEGEICFPDDRRVRFSDVHSVYWRNYNRIPNLYNAPIADYEMAYIAENDSRGLFESILMGLPAKWVNGWEGYQLHQRKPYALALVAGMGVRVPRTMCSNDPLVLQEFQAREARVHNGGVIFKPIQGGTHTERLDPTAMTAQNLAGLNLGPITFQEEIRGTNVRVFVAGDRVMGCEVKTREIDFRDDPRPDIFAIDLSEEIKEQSAKIAARLGLKWTGIDYRVTKDGEYVYLEANPSPMFQGFEQVSGLPLSAALVDLLLT